MGVEMEIEIECAGFKIKKGTNIYIYSHRNMCTYINILDLFCGINHPNVVSILLVRDA